MRTNDRPVRSPNLTDWASCQKGAESPREHDWPGVIRQPEERRVVKMAVNRRDDAVWPGGFGQPGGR